MLFVGDGRLSQSVPLDEIRGSRSSVISASNLARSETPMMSKATAASWKPVSSNSFSSWW